MRAASGVMEAWGLGPQDLKRELIYTRISGYGQTGPKAVQPGYASVCEAYGGLRCVQLRLTIPHFRDVIILSHIKGPRRQQQHWYTGVAIGVTTDVAIGLDTRFPQASPSQSPGTNAAGFAAGI